MGIAPLFVPGSWRSIPFPDSKTPLALRWLVLLYFEVVPMLGGDGVPAGPWHTPNILF